MHKYHHGGIICIGDYDDPFYDGNDNRMDDGQGLYKHPSHRYDREDYYNPSNDPFYDGNDNREWD